VVVITVLPLLSVRAYAGEADRWERAAAEASLTPPRFAWDLDELPPLLHSYSVRIDEHIVEDGDTLGAVAQQYRLTVDTLRWANQLDDPDRLSIGQRLWVPPVDGVLVRVGPSDTLAALLQRFHGGAAEVETFNRLLPGALPPVGAWLMIPDGEGPPVVRPEPPPPPPAARPAVGSSYLRPAVPAGGQSGRFPFGQCTWYVAQKRDVRWSGNAGEWYGNARAMGYPVGSAPSPGAIQVSWESSAGHVAYVEVVHADGSWTVSEMNFAGHGGGWGRVSWRRISPGRIPLIGFIY
jgi:hypothetical protein